jgi:hypothetical protein
MTLPADETLLSGLEGDPQEPALFLTTLGPKLPWFMREGIALALKYVMGDPLVSRLQSVSATKTVTQLQAWQDKRNKYIQAARDEVCWSLNELFHNTMSALIRFSLVPALAQARP